MGSEEGVPEGTSDGLVEGRFDGIADGYVEGLEDGRFVGKEVGFALGALLVGKPVTISLSTLVGTALGTSVKRDGISDGDNVGVPEICVG